VRRPQGCHLPPILAARPRSREVYRTLRTAILNGVLQAGERLPSSRQAAVDYGVSRGLIEDVFARLGDEGFLTRIVGRGTFVTSAVSHLNPAAVIKGSASRPSRRGRVLSANAACREPEVLRPFNAAIADTTEFPWLTWQRLQFRAIRGLRSEALSFADPRGCPMLRAAVSRYLAQFRGIRCEPQHVVIFNSSQQALNGLALLLLERGNAVWLEDPSYPGARAAFSIAGAAIQSVPVDEEGIRVEFGERHCARARLAYVTPSHQYPTGVTLSLQRRLALLDWAARRHAWLIEDDYDGEFRYDGHPLMPLHALDRHARVIFLGTLSKSMFIALRLAYAVVPEGLVEPLASIRTQLDGFTPLIQQRAMSFFMDEGHFSTHLRHMRAIYGSKYAVLMEGIKPLTALGWRCSTRGAGMHLLITHDDGEYARRVAAESGVDVATLGSYRRARPRGQDDGLLLRFGGLSIEDIRRGCERLVSAGRAAH